MTELSPEALAEITTQMQGDGVWIDPDFAQEHQITAADERALEQAVAAAADGETPVRVVLVEVPYRSTFVGQPSKLAAWIGDDLDTGYVWVMAEDSPSGIEVASTLDDWYHGYTVSQVLEPGTDDVGARALEAVALTQKSSSELYALEQQARQDRPRPEAPEPEGSAFGWVVGGLVLAGVALLVAARVGWRRWHTARTTFQLSDTVLRQVSTAEQRRLLEEATTRTDALGEALATAGDLAGPLGVVALDHYTAARRVLEEQPTAADLMGALVLAGRGQAALRHLQTGGPQAWQPPVPCWRNPGHPWASTSDGSGHRVCAACADPGTVEVFGVPQGADSVPWYTADLGVWTRTGYGTTEPDLPRALGQ